MPPDGTAGRWLRARYAFRGAAVELDRTLPLAPDEPVVLHGVMRLRTVGLPRPVVLRLSPPRLVLLVHHALRPDRALELPRAAVRGVEVRRRAVHLVWADADGGERVTRLAGWTGRSAVDTTLQDVGTVTDVLRRWLSGSTDLPPVPHSHRHQGRRAGGP